MKILIVDDEREEREGISFLIRKFEYPLDIVYAVNGEEALHIVETQKIDILFTDIEMPVMNGLELAKKVCNTYPGIKIIIFSAYGEFGYVKQALQANAVSYLLKPIEVEEFKQLMTAVIGSVCEVEKKEQLEKEEEKQNRKNLLYKVFTHGRIKPEEEMKVGQVLFSKENSVFRLMNMEFVNNFFEEYEAMFLKLVKMYLGKSVDYLELYPNEAYLLIRNAEMMAGDKLECQAEKLVRDIKLKTNDESVTLISVPIGTVEEMRIQLKKINTIKSENFGYEDQIILTEDYCDETSHFESDAEAARKQVLLAIESMDTELIEKQNEQFVKFIRSVKKISKLYTSNLLYSVIKAVYDKNPKIEFEDSLVVAEALFLEKDPKRMFEEYQRILDRMLSTLKNQRQDSSRIVQQIKNLIEKEYMKDISLNYIAESVNLAPAYVSYIFKKETGQTLVKYITDIKMMKAKKLLEEGTLKIVQVGQACGYENQSYFNRLFKNYYGVTPKQFREKA